jgi:uncharacterized protein involved in exopolysaccharide biosynthesis
VENVESRRSELEDVFAIVWNGKWIIAAVTFAVTLGVAVLAWTAPEKYEATVLASPASEEQRRSLGGLGGIASQFGGIAALAGISLNQSSEKSEVIALLQSRILSRRYIEENDLLPVLFAKQWDARGKRWVGVEAEDAPTPWIGTEYFRTHVLEVTENAKTGLVSVSVTWTDPEVAARWANDLVRRANEYLRTQTIDRSERHIAYLEAQATATDVAAVRTAIYALLENEIKTVMLAKGTEEYALKVIDPATPPEIRSSPKRRIWVSVGFLAGLSISLVIVFLRRARQG